MANTTVTIYRAVTADLYLPLVVDLAVSGTATFPTDYTVTGATSFTATTASVTIPANQTSKAITLFSVADTISESDETVILTLIPTFNVSSGSGAVTWTILNDDINDGDTNGLFYYIGSNNKTIAWVNPYPKLVYSIAATGAVDNLNTLTDRSVNPHPDNTWCFNSSYVQVDIGAGLKIKPTYVSLRAWINNDRHPRTFDILGSVDGISFTTLLSVVNNTTITAPIQWLTLPIPATGVAYRYLRYLCIQHSEPTSDTNVVLGEWEFYGEIIVV